MFENIVTWLLSSEEIKLSLCQIEGNLNPQETMKYFICATEQNSFLNRENFNKTHCQILIFY